MGMAVREMRARPDLDTWYSRVKSIKAVLDIKYIRGSKESVSKYFDKRLKSSFDRFWLDQVNQDKIDISGNDRNKLRFYKKLKGTFSPEPYTFRKDHQL